MEALIQERGLIGTQVNGFQLPTFRSAFERPADVKILSRMNHL